MSDLKTNLGAILATDFSEGDFGIKKNLAIGALAASAALNPIKANASLPVRSDGLFYTSEFNPYPIGMFDKKTGERVKDPKKVYEATKSYQYYLSPGAYAPSVSGKDLPEITEHNNAQRDRALKQTELDEKNKLWYGDGKDIIRKDSYEDGVWDEGYFKTGLDPSHEYKALINHSWRSVDNHGKPRNPTINDLNFSEGDFGIKKNLAIGALAASAALNPMKANASVPVRSDGMVYISEDNPYPIGLFDKTTGRRVTDPQEAYEATKRFPYYSSYAVSVPLHPDSPVDTPKQALKKAIEKNERARDNALKQTELDEKNRRRFGDDNPDVYGYRSMGERAGSSNKSNPRYIHKALVDGEWVDTDDISGHPKNTDDKWYPTGSRSFSEQVDLLSGKARKANVKKEAQDLESLKRRIDLIPDPSVRDALNKDWESLNKDRVSRAWVRIPGKVGVASSLASVPATLATMAVAPAIALPLAAIGGAGLAFSANQVRVANRAALRPAIDQLEEKVRKAEQDTIYARMMANPANAQLPAKA